MTRLKPTMELMENIQQDDVTEEVWNKWKFDRGEFGTAQQFLSESKMKLSQAMRMQANRKSTPTVTSGAQVRENKSVSSSSASVYSSASSKVRDLELEAKGKSMQLRHQIEGEISDLDDQIQLLEVQLNDPSMLVKVPSLLLEKKMADTKRDQLKRKLIRESAAIKENVALQKEIIDSAEENKIAELEAETGEGIPIQNRTETWLNSQQDFDKPEDIRTPDDGNDKLFHAYHQPVNRRLQPNAASFYPSWHESQFQTGSQPVENKIVPPPPPPPRHSDSNDSVAVGQLASAFRDIVVELRGNKEWDLLTFDGKAEDWPIFIGEFNRTTPKGLINSSQNAIRLRKAITGSAKEAVVGLLHEPKNCSRVLQILEQHFGRKELILESLARKAEVVKAPDIHKPETFILFGRAVLQLVETARSLNDVRYLNDIGLQSKLIGKLPALQAQQWIQWITDRPSKTDNLGSFCDWVEQTMSVLVKIAKPPVIDSVEKGKQQRGSARVHTTSTEPVMSERICHYCEKTNHLIHQCFSFKKQSLDSKLKVIQEKGLCFRCLYPGHHKRDCTSKIVCNVADCNKEHHPLLHRTSPAISEKQKQNNFKKEEIQETVQGQDEEAKTKEESKTYVTNSLTSDPISVCQIRVRGPAGVKRCYALLDSGSTKTLIDEEFATELGIGGESFEHTIIGVKNIKITENAKYADFEVAGAYRGAKFYNISKAFTTKDVGIPPHSQDAEEAKKKFPYLKRAKLQSYQNVVVKVIIGEDHPKLTAHRDLCEQVGGNQMTDNPMAKRTLLGWVLGGKLEKGVEPVTRLHYMSEAVSVDNMTKQAFSVESSGIINSTTQGSLEELRSGVMGARLSNEKSSRNESRWVLNLADDGTRQQSEVKLMASSRWLQEPDFLMESEDKWSVQDRVTDGDNDESELRKKSIVGVHLSCQDSKKVNCVIKMERFSSFVRLVRVIAGVRAVIKYWKIKVLGTGSSVILSPPWKLDENAVLPKRNYKEDSNCYMKRMGKVLKEKVKPFLSPDDIEQGKLDVLRFVQEETFSQDIRDLDNGKLNKSSDLWRLTPFLENGLLKMSGRIVAAIIAQEVKTPTISPAKHHVTELIIRQEHENSGYQGTGTVLSNLRQRYWIVTGRATVRRVIGDCFPCRVTKVTPIVPRMGDLPSYRLSSGQPPFTFTGVDNFGPLEVTVGRHHEKRWVALFTCLVTRAVHLELAYGLSSDDFLLAFSRFIDTRGRSKFMLSDNGTNFVGAKKELKDDYEACDWSTILENNQVQEIKWQFTPPGSPHFGGVWERKVQSVKKVLPFTLKEKYPQDKTPMTILKGAENIVNSAPLTYVSEDPRDASPLTPNHFLRGFCDVGPSIPGKFEMDDETRREHWRRAQGVLQQFWERWINEVLPEMAKRSKWFKANEGLQVGELVLLVDEQLPRNIWKRGLVTSTFPGKDGQIRVVEVVTVDVNGKKTTYKRGVDKLCPLGNPLWKIGLNIPILGVGMLWRQTPFYVNS